MVALSGTQPFDRKAFLLVLVVFWQIISLYIIEF